MIQCLKEMPEVTIQPEKTVRLLIQWFAVLRECVVVTATDWDDNATGPVCCIKPPFTLLKVRLTSLSNRDWQAKLWTTTLITLSAYSGQRHNPEL